MNLLLVFVTFGLVGAVIGALAMIPLRRWWMNRKYAGCVELWGINTGTGLWERHMVRPQPDTLDFTMDDGTAVSAPVNSAAGGQVGSRRAYLVDLAKQTQVFVKPDGEATRLSGKWIRDVVKGGLLPQIDAIQNGRNPFIDRNMLFMMIGLIAVTVLGFIITGVMVAGIEEGRQTVGTVTR